MSNINKTQESGRSMVEMLGVLAVIGVLSVAGIAGYTTAMNKHRANEILNAASIRAVMVSTKLQKGSTVDIANALVEFGEEDVQGVSFGEPSKVGDNQFKIPLSGTGLTTEICSQMKNIVGENGIVNISDDCGTLTYNNDLSAGVQMGATWDSNGDGATTGDQDCSSAPSGCQICVKGELVDSNAKCGANKVCHDGTCSDSELTEGEGDCLKNSDCRGSDGPYYCNYGGNVDCSSGPSGKVGTCTKVSASLVNSNLAGFVQGAYMDWYSAKNFCAAQNKRMASISDLGCPYTVAEYRATNANYPFGYCCSSADGIQTKCTNGYATKVQAITDKVQDGFWLNDVVSTNSCYAFRVFTNLGLVGTFNRYGRLNVYYALCE